MLLRLAAGAAFVLLFVATSVSQQTSSDVQAEIRQGIEALQRSDFSGAEQHLSKALAADPGLSEVRANLGLAYYADRKYAQATEAFELALKQNSSLATAQTFLPLSLVAQDKYEAALPGLRRQFSTHPDVKLRRILGLSLQRCLLATGRQAEADQVTQELLAKFPDDVDVLYEAGQMYGKLSSQLYLRLLKVAPQSARGYQVMGQVAATDGNWQKAVEAYREAIRLDPHLAGVRLDMAMQLLLHSPDPDAWKQALTALQEELNINPGSAEAHYEVGEVYRKHDEPSRAIAAFRDALRLRPDFVEARLELAKALRQQNQKQEALAVLEPARQAAPDNPAVHFLLAQLYRDLDRPEEARREEETFKKLQQPVP